MLTLSINTAKHIPAKPVDLYLMIAGGNFKGARKCRKSASGCSILNMIPATAVTYAGDAVCAVLSRSEAPLLTLVLGHLRCRPRRLVEAFTEDARDHFTRTAARDLVVA